MFIITQNICSQYMEQNKQIYYDMIIFRFEFIYKQKYQNYQLMTTKTTTKITTASILASKVQLDNILQFTLTQTTLEANFKAIIQAITDHQNDINHLNTNTKDNNDKFNSLSSAQDATSKQMNSLKELIKDLSHKVQLNQSENKKNSDLVKLYSANEQSQRSSVKRNNSQFKQAEIDTKEWAQLLKQIQGIKDKQTKEHDERKKITESLSADIQKIKKELQQKNVANSHLSNLQSKLKDLQKLSKDLQNSNKLMMQKLKQNQKSIQKLTNSSEQNKLDKSLEEIQNKLEQFIKNTYQPEIEKIYSKLTQLEGQNASNKSLIQEEKRLRSLLNQQIWKLHDSISKQTQNGLAQQMNLDTIKYLQKQVAELKKKLGQLTDSKYKFGNHHLLTEESPTKFRHTDLQISSPKNEGSGNMELKEDLAQRMKTLKSDFMKSLRKFDAKNQSDLSQYKKKFDAINDAIMRLEHILADKANWDSVKKLISNLQNKVTYLYTIFFGGQSQQDACIARKNWICLSCDKRLDKYQGKIGQHLANAQLKSKMLDQDTVGGGMNFKAPSKGKLDLPTVLSKSSKKL